LNAWWVNCARGLSGPATGFIYEHDFDPIIEAIPPVIHADETRIPLFRLMLEIRLHRHPAPA
jgi:hypothetical protein